MSSTPLRPEPAPTRNSYAFSSSASPQRRALVVCDQWLGSNGYAGMKALRRAGWSVHVVPEWELVPVRWKTGFMRVIGRVVRPFAAREFNQELVRQATRTAPELLLVFKGNFVEQQTLTTLRDRGIQLYCFYPDVSVRTHGSRIPRALPRYHWVFSTKSFGIHDLRAQFGMTNVSLLRHAFDADLHRPLSLSAEDETRYGCDVSFIGTWSAKKEALLADLARHRPNLKIRIWGEQWHSAAGRSRKIESLVQGRGVEGDEYVKAVVASKINVAILSERRAGASSGDVITSRTFHIPACGAFMLHERTSEVLDVFREMDDIACFEGADELVNRIDTFLSMPGKRAAMATRALETVQAHSWDHRIREILLHHDTHRG